MIFTFEFRARLEGRESQNSPANTPHTARDSPIIPQNVLTSNMDLLKNLKTIQNSMNEMEDTNPDIEMHTFRDAIDVNYQRMALTEDELSGVNNLF